MTASKRPERGAGAPASGPASPEATSRDGDALSFEQALAELEGIVDDLENGSLALEDSLSRFERGIQLSRHLEQRLSAAEARVRRLVDGDAAAESSTPSAGTSSGETTAPSRAAREGGARDHAVGGEDSLF